MSEWASPMMPPYRLLAWEGEPAVCRGWMSPCEERAVLVMPLPDRDVQMPFCLVHWEPMADDLIKRGQEFMVTNSARAVLGGSGAGETAGGRG